MGKLYFQYNIGDLVKFTHGHLGASITRTGIVIGQSFRYTKDNVFKIRTEGKDYWVPRTRIELLSKVMDAGSK
jgi:hypothetical protein